MGYDYEGMQRLPVDAKVVDQIRRSPTMSSEQGEVFMSRWGGASQYIQLARLPMEERLCYAAVSEGVTDEDQVEIVTGLTSKQVSKGLEGLKARGLVTIE